MSANSRLDNWAKRLELLKNITEIIALAAAGWWAWHTFLLKDQPKLMESIYSSNKLKIDSINHHRCKLDYTLEIKNIGLTSFKLDSIKFYAWAIPLDSIITGSFFNLDGFVKDNKAAAGTDTSRFISGGYSSNDNLLTHVYPPDHISNETFSFFGPKNDTMSVVFAYEIFAHSGSNNFMSSGNCWEPKCIPNTSK